jgi:hypothetical protein
MFPRKPHNSYAASNNISNTNSLRQIGLATSIELQALRCSNAERSFINKTMLVKHLSTDEVNNQVLHICVPFTMLNVMRKLSKIGLAMHNNSYEQR